MRSPGCLRNCMLPLQDSHPTTKERPNENPAPRMMHAPVVSQLFAPCTGLPARHHCLHARTNVRSTRWPEWTLPTMNLCGLRSGPKVTPFLFLPKPQWSVQQGKRGHVLVELASATWWSPPKSCLPAAPSSPAPRRTHVRGGRGPRSA